MSMAGYFSSLFFTYLYMAVSPFPPYPPPKVTTRNSPPALHSCPAFANSWCVAPIDSGSSFPATFNKAAPGPPPHSYIHGAYVIFGPFACVQLRFVPYQTLSRIWAFFSPSDFTVDRKMCTL